MKPHFGQSDAAMNKLAGCNKFENGTGSISNQKVLDGLKTIASLELQAKNAGFETPFEHLKAKHEEAAGMGLEPEFFERLKVQPMKNRTENMTPEPLPKGYYGHEDGCDCAVCENMYFHELHLNRVAADIEAIKQNAYQAGFNAAKQDCVTILEKMPSRIEPISGQNFTYIKKFVAIDAIQQLGI